MKNTDALPLKPAIVLTCEHGVNTIPPDYARLFESHQALLDSHRGIDFGALALAKRLQEVLSGDFIKASVSRLLIDCNRSLKHRSCFSEITQPLPETLKTALIQKYYLPYRRCVEQTIEAHLNNDHQVWHISVHSFTPVWDNHLRNADIGLLYDPKSLSEKPFARRLKHIIRTQDPQFRLRMNYPYKGITDGFTTALRKKHPATHYMGLEIEINQGLVSDKQRFHALQEVFMRSFRELLQEY